MPVSRSHPPALLKLTERTLHDEQLLRRGQRALVAVSGGPDSLALLHVLSKLAPELGFSLCAHGIDHGLREAARTELEVAAALAAQLSIPFRVTSLRVTHGGNLMERARHARLDALEAARAAEGCDVIATGHHADDRAETVLIRLLRGTGPRGLAVLPAQSGRLVRPLLKARRADILAHLARHRISYADDPSNLNPRFVRTRVRTELLPLLRELSPNIVEHLNDLAEAMVNQLADAMVSGGDAPDDRTLLALGRDQRKMANKALKTRNARARIPLSGGRVAKVDLPTGRIVLMNEDVSAVGSGESRRGR